MKKKLLLFLGLLLCIGIAVVIFVKGNQVHQKEIAYSGSTNSTSTPQVYDDNGMYYFKNGYLMFMDNTTGESVPLCTKANCSHDSADCDACYQDSSGQEILLYDDMVYVSYFTTEYYTDSNGALQNAGVVRLECCKKDGTGRKQIYESDTGAVISMLALDGRLYFTAWESQPGTDDMTNYYMEDNYLYCYDMDWGITKKLLVCQGDSEHYNASLTLFRSEDREQLYIQYGYNIQEDTNKNRMTEWWTLDMKGNILAQETLPADINIADAWVNKDGAYIVKYTDDLYQYDDLPVKTCVWKEDGEEEQLLVDEDVEDGISIKISESAFQYLTGYRCFIGNENLKLFIDYDEEQYYIAKSAVSDYHIVPDIYLIDKENDIIYYDTTDYTGVADGTIYSYDPTSLSCMKWSEFLEEYFVEYEGQEVEGLTIGTLDEQ